MIPFLSYHQRTVEYLKQRPTLWQYFSDNSFKKEQLHLFKTDLLKNTYKFDAEAEPALYSKVQLSKEKLGLDIPVILYQAQYSEENNASVIYLQNEAHIVFSGKLLQLLNDEEQLALIAHELSHVRLYTEINGDIEVADRIIDAIASSQECTPPQYETSRLFKLYTEIYCDRGAYLVTNNYAPIITSLVKLATGLNTVNADSYIKQAEEIFILDNNVKTTGVSHPENFIRARSISLWHVKGAECEKEIVRMIEGTPSLEEIDLFSQLQLTDITKQVIRLILNPAWMKTAQIEILGKQYFSDIEFGINVDREKLANQISPLHFSLKDYIGYVLYDFSVADKQLEDIPLGYLFSLADELKIEKSFATAIKKERKLTDKKISSLKKQSLEEFNKQAKQLAL